MSRPIENSSKQKNQEVSLQLSDCEFVVGPTPFGKEDSIACSASTGADKNAIVNITADFLVSTIMYNDRIVRCDSFSIPENDGYICKFGRGSTSSTIRIGLSGKDWGRVAYDIKRMIFSNFLRKSDDLLKKSAEKEIYDPNDIDANRRAIQELDDLIRDWPKTETDRKDPPKP